MTLQQMLAFAVIAGTMALFVWGRLRYDMVAVLALLVSVLIGIVPEEQAFAGFGDEIVIIVASALVVSAGVARSGVIEVAIQKIAPRIRSVQAQIVLLVTTVALMSALVKNIGALAIMMPIAFQMAKRSNASVSCYLMPMAFASLLGGLITLIGTSPNIIVARVRAELTDEPFGMFDYAPVGLALTAAGVLFLSLGYRLLPGGRRAAPAMGEALDIQDYVTEARVAPGSKIEGKTVADLAGAADNEITVTTVVRNKTEAHRAWPDTVLRGRRHRPHGRAARCARTGHRHRELGTRGQGPARRDRGADRRDRRRRSGDRA